MGEGVSQVINRVTGGWGGVGVTGRERVPFATHRQAQACGHPFISTVTSATPRLSSRRWDPPAGSCSRCRERRAGELSEPPQKGVGRSPSTPCSPLHLHATSVSSTSSLLEGRFLLSVSISSSFLFLRCFRQWLFFFWGGDNN